MRLACPVDDSAFARAIDQQVPIQAVVGDPLFVEGHLKRQVGHISGLNSEAGYRLEGCSALLVSLDGLAIPSLGGRGLAGLLIEQGQLIPALLRSGQVAMLLPDARRFQVMPFGLLPLLLLMQ